MNARLISARIEHALRRGLSIELASAACLLASLVGCGGGGEVEPDSWDVSFVVGSPECLPIRVLHKGEIVAEYAQRLPGDPVESHTIDGRFVVPVSMGSEVKQSEDADYYTISADFRFEQLTPDGWREFLKPELRLENIHWTRKVNLVQIGTPQLIDSLIVDNRNHDAVTIQCGELKLKVAANSAPVLNFNFFETDEHGERLENTEPPATWEIKLDDAPIGMMTEGTTCLIDVSGERRYALNEIVYSFAPQFKEPFSDSYASAHLHQLPESVGSIDYLFEAAPEEIETYGYGTTRRWELTDDEG